MKVLYAGLMVVMLAGCSLSTKDQGAAPPHEQNSAEEMSVMAAEAQTRLENLDIPWSMTKKENIMYISERKGAVVKFDEADGTMERQSLSLAKKLHLEGEGGFLGFVLTPGFPEKPYAYAYYTFKENGTIYNRVVLMEQMGNRWVEKSVLLDRIPGAKFHNGGRLKIGPDGMLYVTTGDALTPETAQDRKSLGGKILRMTQDGLIPEDNPFPNSYIYSYGHRNPQGLAWDEKGTLYSSEHGQSAHDEINRIQPGQNYGWPVIQGDAQANGMITPLFHSGTTTWAPSGISYHQGKLYAATLAGSRILAFDLEKGKIATVFSNGGRMRDTLIENDHLYFISNNRDGRGAPAPNDDRLYRLSLKD
ncbi:MAG TPA: PQQ-dependent sugar dehydrogenase [Bacillus sp. (in: firmicutes)]|nr:PQQ-dependent sugar dehydrogenase [Bacillus sp. (in: firmicutes)]